MHVFSSIGRTHACTCLHNHSMAATGIPGVWCVWYILGCLGSGCKHPLLSFHLVSCTNTPLPSLTLTCPTLTATTCASAFQLFCTVAVDGGHNYKSCGRCLQPKHMKMMRAKLLLLRLTRALVTASCCNTPATRPRPSLPVAILHLACLSRWTSDQPSYRARSSCSGKQFQFVETLCI